MILLRQLKTVRLTQLNGLSVLSGKQSQSEVVKWTNDSFLKHRCRIFDEVLNAKRIEHKRIEKIDVFLNDPIVATTGFSNPSCQETDSSSNDNNVLHLRMNKGISTPYDCALHVNAFLAERSALAIVNGEPWDMHKPLEGLTEVQLEFVHFKESDKHRAELVNKAYLRSSTLVLGYLLETSFKRDFFVQLCSFPPINLKAPCILYDAKLNLIPEHWNPRCQELRCMSIQAYKIRDEALNFEPLQVSPSEAKQMFCGNELKMRQIDAIMARNKGANDKLTVYRIGEFVDICQGPCISNTNMIGRFEVAAVHEIDTNTYGKLSRVQALSIPSQLHLHYWTFEWLLRRAANPSPASLPSINI